jgi:hypothetical protein
MTGEDKIMIYLEGHNQPMRTESHKHSEITDKIIKAFYSVTINRAMDFLKRFMRML